MFSGTPKITTLLMLGMFVTSCYGLPQHALGGGEINVASILFRCTFVLPQHGVRSGLTLFSEPRNQDKFDDGVLVRTGSRSGHASAVFPSKAFDTVNSILVSKLDLNGLQSNEDQWFRSCRGKSKQKGFVSGVESNFLLLMKLRSTTRGNSRSSSLHFLIK